MFSFTCRDDYDVFVCYDFCFSLSSTRSAAHSPSLDVFAVSLSDLPFPHLHINYYPLCERAYSRVVKIYR